MKPIASLKRFDIVRSVDGGSYLETLLVSAVTAILAIRLYLELTGYPRIGGRGLHIAHMLWGGLLLLVAVVLLLGFLGKRAKRLAAVVGGIGFGAFIDELGKFITSDNDYFYRPTVGLIYVILIVLFLTFRQFQRRDQLSSQEYLVNAADMIAEVILDGARSGEIAQALRLLERSGPPVALSEAIREAVLSAARVEDEGEPSFPARLAGQARRTYTRLLGWRWFQRVVVLIFAVNGTLTLGSAALLLVTTAPSLLSDPESRSFVTIGGFIASATASLMITIGTVRLVRSRLSAYRWFKRAVLVWIFFAQVFLFFESQLAALSGLLFDLALLAGLNYMLRAELSRAEAARIDPTSSRIG